MLRRDRERRLRRHRGGLHGRRRPRGELLARPSRVGPRRRDRGAAPARLARGRSARSSRARPRTTPASIAVLTKVGLHRGLAQRRLRPGLGREVEEIVFALRAGARRVADGRNSRDVGIGPRRLRRLAAMRRSRNVARGGSCPYRHSTRRFAAGGASGGRGPPRLGSQQPLAHETTKTPEKHGGLLHFVREGGVEPPRPFGHWHLKPARLPIPPLARVAASGDAANSTSRGYHADSALPNRAGASPDPSHGGPSPIQPVRLACTNRHPPSEEPRGTT